MKNKPLKITLIIILAISMGLLVDFAWYRYRATSDKNLLSYSFWKHYSGHCESGVYLVTAEMIPMRNKTWTVKQRWDGRIFLTLLNKDKKNQCTYIH